MIGAMLTNQQPLQKIIGVYYICQDMVLLSQFAYYSKIYPRRGKRASQGIKKGYGSSEAVIPLKARGK